MKFLNRRWRLRVEVNSFTGQNAERLRSSKKGLGFRVQGLGV